MGGLFACRVIEAINNLLTVARAQLAGSDEFIAELVGAEFCYMLLFLSGIFSIFASDMHTDIFR